MRDECQGGAALLQCHGVVCARHCGNTVTISHTNNVAKVIGPSKVGEPTNREDFSKNIVTYIAFDCKSSKSQKIFTSKKRKSDEETKLSNSFIVSSANNVDT